MITNTVYCQHAWCEDAQYISVYYIWYGKFFEVQSMLMWIWFQYNKMDKIEMSLILTDKKVCLISLHLW